MGDFDVHAIASETDDRLDFACGCWIESVELHLIVHPCSAAHARPLTELLIGEVLLVQDEIAVVSITPMWNSKRGRPEFN